MSLKRGVDRIGLTLKLLTSPKAHIDPEQSSILAANAKLPSTVFPLALLHLIRPNLRPMILAKASPIPNEMTPK